MRKREVSKVRIQGNLYKAGAVVLALMVVSRSSGSIDETSLRCAETSSPHSPVNDTVVRAEQRLLKRGTLTPREAPLERRLTLLADSIDLFGWHRGRVLGPSSALCLGTSGSTEELSTLHLAACNTQDPGQTWYWKNKWVRADDGAALVLLRNEASGLVLQSTHDSLALNALRLRPFASSNSEQQFKVERCDGAIEVARAAP